MKKIVVLVVSIFMMLSFVVGCSSANNPDGGTQEQEQKSEMEAEVETEAETEAETSDSSLPFEGIKISLLTEKDNGNEGIEAVCELAKEKLGLTVDIEYHVGGDEGGNLVKTRLASGDMADILQYNSGSLLSSLNPLDYFLDISDQPFMSKIDESFLSTVTIDDVVYGIPFSTIMSGGILYNKAVYEELDLDVPKTWDEFLQNCDVIKQAGHNAVIGTYGDSWTSQVLFLGDHYNVLAETPDFAEKFEAGEIKFASSAAGTKSFQKLLDIQPYLNKDYSVATYNEGVDMLALGEGVHWPMLSFALSNMNALYPEAMENIGMFAIPGDDPDNVGLTIWMPNALYVNKNAENIDAILAFFELYLSEEGLDAFTAAFPPTGAYTVKGYELPEDTMSVIKEDMQYYVDSGKTAPALEFQTAVKGPNCPAICTEVGSGQITAIEAAEAYDDDCLKQAIQLGLDW